jgi:hypothetical protein
MRVCLKVRRDGAGKFREPFFVISELNFLRFSLPHCLNPAPPSIKIHPKAALQAVLQGEARLFSSFRVFLASQRGASVRVGPVSLPLMSPQCPRQSGANQG